MTCLTAWIILMTINGTNVIGETHYQSRMECEKSVERLIGYKARCVQ
jgi:hypothetical protein